jgi:hypothetical protein
MKMYVHDLGCTRSFRATDTDVLVLAIGHFQKMTTIELWIGCGKNYRYIAVHGIANFIEPGKAQSCISGIPCLHRM